MSFVLAVQHPPCHPRAGGGPGEQTRSCRREELCGGYIFCVALGPRLRGGDKKGGVCKR
jgi:hypothetical protein